MKKFLAVLPILYLLSGCTTHIDIEKPQYTTVSGTFCHEMNLTDTSGTEDIYYQFRSHDDEVWWILTSDEIGHVPESNTEYNLTFYDCGTTEPYENCDCTADMDCECYLYDDVFIEISKAE